MAWEYGARGKGKSCALISIEATPKWVTGSVALTHGWLAKPDGDWRLTEESLEEMLKFAEENGRRILRTPKSSGRKMKARVPKIDPRQKGLFE